MKLVQNACEAKMVRKLIKRDSLNRRTDRVKNREVAQMQQLRGDGLTDTEIAAKLKRKPQTIKRHLGSVRSRQEPYEETLHKQKMRELAKAMAEGIRLPSPWDKDLWRDLPIEFQPGKYSLPIGVVDISENRQIEVSYYDIGVGNAESHLVKGLFSHLTTFGVSKFAELVGDKGKFNCLVGEAGQYSQALLLFLKLIADEVKGYRAKVNYHDEAKPGLTKWFIITAWNDALQRAGSHFWIDDSWYKPPEPGTTPPNLWQLRCGAYVIGIAKSKKTLKIYENWHKKLRVKYAKDPLAKDITVKAKELGNIVQEIRGRLQEFSDMERLSGHCELC